MFPTLPGIRRDVGPQLNGLRSVYKRYADLIPVQTGARASLNFTSFPSETWRFAADVRLHWTTGVREPPGGAESRALH